MEASGTSISTGGKSCGISGLKPSCGDYKAGNSVYTIFIAAKNQLPLEELAMFRDQWKKEVFTIPNLLSLLRLLFIPVYLTVYLNAGEPRDYYFAGGILAVSCVTDALDGMIARHFHSITTLGKILDPLADKITQFTLILCLSFRYVALRPVLYLLVAKELFQLVAGIINLRHGQMLSGALLEGKISTAVLFATLIILVMFPTNSSAMVHAFAAIDIFLLVISFRGYILAYLGYYPQIQSKRE